MSVKDKWKIILPLAFMLVVGISMWPGMSTPLAKALGLFDGQGFSAGYALAFCAGVYFPKRLRWTLTLGTFLIVNILTNHFYYHVSPFDRYLWLKIGAFSVLIWLGTRYSAKNNWFKLVGGGLLGAIFFYIITNTASWLWDPAYAKNIAGWLQALTIGSPGFPPTILFLLNSLISGGLFTGLFAGAMKLTAAADEKTEDEPEEAPEAEKSEGEGIVPAPEKSEA
jgi:hypothetical protein